MNRNHIVCINRFLCCLMITFLIACNGGESSSQTINISPQANLLPIAITPADFNTTENAFVVLDGSTSSDSDGNIVSYLWVQTSGSPTVTLTSSGTATASFTAPLVSITTPLTFQLTVMDDQGATGTNSVIVSVTDSAATNSISSIIFPSRTTCTAPCGIMFDATGTTSAGVTEPFHQLYYRWNYGDTGSNFQQRAGIDANQSASPIGAHVFDQAGIYTVTLIVTGDDGGTDTQTVDIMVDDAAVVYAAETYCVSSSSNFAGCPIQDSNFHFTSFAQAANFMGNLRSNQMSRPTRILFRADDTFTASSQITIRDLTASILIGSFASGNAPRITIDSAMTDIRLFYIHDSSDITFTGLNFAGNYDPTTGTGSHPSVIWFYTGSSHTLVYRNQFSAVGNFVYPHGDVSSLTGKASEYAMIVDNQMSNWQDYAIFGTFGYLSTLLANSIKQDINAASGSDGKCGSCIPNYPDHGPIRSGYSDHLLIQYNDMFNNAGWSSGGLAHQPNIRLGTGGTSRQSIIADNVLEGGFTTISMTPANPGTAEAAVIADVIIERNQLTASANTWQSIDMGLGGSTIRNNLFLKPDNGGPPIGSGSYETPIVFKVADDRTTAGNLTLMNRIYNNTLISLAQLSAPNVALVEVENNFTQFEIHNNIAYLPFVSSTAEAGIISWMYSGSMNNVTAENNLLFAPATLNYLWQNGVSLDLAAWQLTGNGANSLVVDPLLSNPSNFDGTLTLTSAAISAGINRPGLRTDKNDKIRDANVDIGAYEF